MPIGIINGLLHFDLETAPQNLTNYFLKLFKKKLGHQLACLVDQAYLFLIVATALANFQMQAKRELVGNRQAAFNLHTH